jgi:CDP-diglyceride synthetase
VRGVVSSFLATPLVALLMGFQWEVGALVAGGAVAGDLFSSFVKRRLGFPPAAWLSVSIKSRSRSFPLPPAAFCCR